MANQLNLDQPFETVASAPPTANRGRTLAMVVAVVLVVGLLGVAALGLRNANAPRPERGRLAPTFTLPLFGGGQVQLAEQRGKVVVVNFWASWCVPCIDEAPELNKAWQTYKDKGVVFLGVDYIDTEPKALEFLKKHGVEYPNGPDLGSRISLDYRIKGVPETFVIDKNGIVQYVKIGPTTLAELQAVIDPLLN